MWHGATHMLSGYDHLANENDMELPMQTIPPTISYVLHTLAQYDDKDLKLNESIVNDAIAYSD